MGVKFIEQTGLTFDDVLIVPKRSSIYSRKDVSLTTRLVGDLTIDVPIISANMDTVTELTMATEMRRLGGLGVIHRFIPDPRAHAEMVSATPGPRVMAIGVKTGDIDKLGLVTELHGVLIDGGLRRSGQGGERRQGRHGLQRVREGQRIFGRR